jgi:hypothetical protein
MKKTNIIEDEIDRIRVSIYEKTKNMSCQEFLEYFKKRGEEASKKYGFQIAKSMVPNSDVEILDDEE